MKDFSTPNSTQKSFIDNQCEQVQRLIANCFPTPNCLILFLPDVIHFDPYPSAYHLESVT